MIASHAGRQWATRDGTHCGWSAHEASRYGILDRPPSLDPLRGLRERCIYLRDRGRHSWNTLDRHLDLTREFVAVRSALYPISVGARISVVGEGSEVQLGIATEYGYQTQYVINVPEIFQKSKPYPCTLRSKLRPGR